MATAMEPLTALGVVISGKLIVSVVAGPMGGSTQEMAFAAVLQLAEVLAANAIGDRRRPSASSGCWISKPAGATTTTDCPGGDCVSAELLICSDSVPAPPAESPPLTVEPGSTPSAGPLGGVVGGPVVGGSVVGGSVVGGSVVDGPVGSAVGGAVVVG